MRFACGSASAEALGVRPSQETLRCGVCALRVGPPLPRRRALAPCRSAASQEPPGAARDRQGQPGATRSHQEQPGARIAARSRQEPPGTRQEQPEVAEIGQFVELSYVLEHGAATSKARSRQEPPGAARNRSSRQGNQEQPGIPNCLIRGTVVYVGPCQSWEPNLCWSCSHHLASCGLRL